MAAHLRAFALLTQFILQRLALGVFLIAALVLSAATIGAALGLLPWLEFDAAFGGVVYHNAGQIAQIGLTGLAVLLCFFLPANARVMALENSHRRFNIGMQDVARAYHAAHAADRSGVFQLSSEFDAVRERLAYLRDHPELGALEPDLLEVAAQMSHISRELAEVYSDDKVSRARTSLRQRQQEVDAFNARLDQAKQITQELKHWSHEVELEESVAASQLSRLRDDLRDVLPELGIEEMLRHDGTVIDLNQKAAE
ncbi:DNA repair protein [uncultured Roseovarius sp.]|uniref:DNA repair protein n=1 Tax=uncultured Roseovarius sp. TaxID=293344 RepID=UPI00260B8810|nr:DNA repair protein [uncultured Roseovarius sp.]